MEEKSPSYLPVVGLQAYSERKAWIAANMAGVFKVSTASLLMIDFGRGASVRRTAGSSGATGSSLRRYNMSSQSLKIYAHPVYHCQNTSPGLSLSPTYAPFWPIPTITPVWRAQQCLGTEHSPEHHQLQIQRGWRSIAGHLISKSHFLHFSIGLGVKCIIIQTILAYRSTSSK